MHGPLVENAGPFLEGMEEYRPIGAFDVVYDMEINTLENSGRAARPFYEILYAYRSTALASESIPSRSSA